MLSFYVKCILADETYVFSIESEAVFAFSQGPSVPGSYTRFPPKNI